DVQVDATNVLADCAADAGSATFAEVRLMLQHNCAAGPACHGSSGQEGLDLDFATNANLYASLRAASVEFPDLHLIEPGDPNRSYLWLKISGDFTQLETSRCTFPQCGGRMPMQSPLGAEFQICDSAVLYAWIRAGAPQ